MTSSLPSSFFPSAEQRLSNGTTAGKYFQDKDPDRGVLERTSTFERSTLKSDYRRFERLRARRSTSMAPRTRTLLISRVFHGTVLSDVPVTCHGGDILFPRTPTSRNGGPRFRTRRSTVLRGPKLRGKYRPNRAIFAYRGNTGFAIQRQTRGVKGGKTAETFERVVEEERKRVVTTGCFGTKNARL